MKNMYFKTPNIGSAFLDYDEALRYLKGKDHELIKKDDPDFFSTSDNDDDNASMLSSSRRILRKIPRKQKKEVH